MTLKPITYPPTPKGETAMTDQKEFCANRECPYHEIRDEAVNERGRVESSPVRFETRDIHDRTRQIGRKQYIFSVDGKERLFWFCSICASAIETPRFNHVSIGYSPKKDFRPCR